MSCRERVSSSISGMTPRTTGSRSSRTTNDGLQGLDLALAEGSAGQLQHAPWHHPEYYEYMGKATDPLSLKPRPLIFAQHPLAPAASATLCHAHQGPHVQKPVAVTACVPTFAVACADNKFRTVISTVSPIKDILEKGLAEMAGMKQLWAKGMPKLIAQAGSEGVNEEKLSKAEASLLRYCIM